MQNVSKPQWPPPKPQELGIQLELPLPDKKGVKTQKVVRPMGDDYDPLGR